MKMLALALIFVTGTSAFAGSNTSTITCVSDSGRTKVYAESWDLWTQATKVEFTIDGEKVAWENDGAIVYAVKDGVYTVVAGVTEQADAWLRLSSLPKSNNIIVNTGNSVNSTFRARVEGTDPRSGQGGPSPEILVNCTLDYSI